MKKHKKLAFIVIAVALVSCAGVAICLLTAPRQDEPYPSGSDESVRQTFVIESETVQSALDHAISAAILEHNSSAFSNGKFACESHVMLGTLEIKRRDWEPGAAVETVEVYIMALYQEYTYSEAGFTNTGGSQTPCVLTFNMPDNGVFELADYWEPRDGGYYAPDITKRFEQLSPEVISDALDTQKFILEQIQSCYVQAVEFADVDTDRIIERLIETIMSSPAESSNSADYIDAHPIECRELTYYGDYTLRYVFSEFLRGGQTGLKGHIMRSIMDDLIGAEATELPAATGQDYFDQWLALAQRSEDANGPDYMRSNTPKAWLLLEMTAED